MRRTALLASTAVLAITLAPEASAQSVGFSLAPAAQRIEWNDALPFSSDDWMYGGRLNLRFGKWVELQPFYFTKDGYGIDSARAGDLLGADALGRSLDLRHYGTNVQVNLGDGNIAPFARVGAGILRFEPEDAPRQDRIALTAGGGLRFSLGGLQAELFAEQLSFRMNARSLFGPDTASTSPTLRNLAYGGSVVIPLSTGTASSNDDRLRGTTAPIEPFVGRLDFADEFGLERQELAGVRAGIDFSPVFGVRGFYWRGLNDDRDGPAEVSGYGGEAQFNLNSGPGISPYLVVGAGNVDFSSKYRDTAGNARADLSTFILGAGASVRLSDRIRLNAAIRDYIMTTADDLDAVSSTGDITHNPMYTAGLTLSLFGNRDTPRRDALPATEREELERLREELREERRRSDALRRGERDRMTEEREATAVRRMRDSAGVRIVEIDTVRVVRDSVMVRRAPMGAMPGMPAMDPSARWITIPVPVQGEVILRYGVPARSGDSVVTRTEVVPAAPAAQTTPQTAGEIAELERRLNARLDAMQRALERQPTVVQPQVVQPQAVTPQPITVIMGADTTVTYDRASTPVFQRFGTTSRRDLTPYAGLSVGDDRTQAVIGVRADLGPINPGSGFNFVPELAVGLGEGNMSVLALANARYAFGSVSGTSTFRPHITLGGGIFSPTVLAVNTAVGSSIRLRPAAEKPLYLHVELQGLNLFNHTRLLFSVSRSR